VRGADEAALARWREQEAADGAGGAGEADLGEVAPGTPRELTVRRVTASHAELARVQREALAAAGGDDGDHDGDDDEDEDDGDTNKHVDTLASSSSLEATRSVLPSSAGASGLSRGHAVKTLQTVTPISLLDSITAGEELRLNFNFIFSTGTVIEFAGEYALIVPPNTAHVGHVVQHIGYSTVPFSLDLVRQESYWPAQWIADMHLPADPVEIAATAGFSAFDCAGPGCATHRTMAAGDGEPARDDDGASTRYGQPWVSRKVPYRYFSWDGKRLTRADGPTDAADDSPDPAPRRRAPRWQAALGAVTVDAVMGRAGNNTGAAVGDAVPQQVFAGPARKATPRAEPELSSQPDHAPPASRRERPFASKLEALLPARTRGRRRRARTGPSSAAPASSPAPPPRDGVFRLLARHSPTLGPAVAPAGPHARAYTPMQSSLAGAPADDGCMNPFADNLLADFTVRRASVEQDLYSLVNPLGLSHPAYEQHHFAISGVYSATNTFFVEFVVERVS
jgi:hypothetical protein